MRVRSVIVFLLILIVFFGLHAYIGWNGLVFLEHSGASVSKGWYWAIIGLLAFSFILARAGERWTPRAITIPLKWIGSYWFAIFQYGVLLLPIADLLYIGLRLTGCSADAAIPPLGYGFLTVLGAILLRGSWNAWQPVVRTYELQINKQAGDVKELRVAVASDLHLGTVVRKWYLKLLADRIRGLNPDLVLFPGDVLDDSFTSFKKQNMGEVMRTIRAPLGVYAVLGNHEYYGGHIPEYMEHMKDCGVRVLTDEVVAIAGGSIIVAGRKDLTAERMKLGRLPLEELLSGADREKPIIVLDHQPYRYDKAEQAGVDVMLSGHTHRGQMAPNHWITGKLFELDWGYKRIGNLHAVVSSGYGTWGPPIRLGSRSEIVQLVIKFTKEA